MILDTSKENIQTIAIISWKIMNTLQCELILKLNQCKQQCDTILHNVYLCIILTFQRNSTIKTTPSKSSNIITCM